MPLRRDIFRSNYFCFSFKFYIIFCTFLTLFFEIKKKKCFLRLSHLVAIVVRRWAVITWEYHRAAGFMIDATPAQHDTPRF